MYSRHDRRDDKKLRCVAVFRVAPVPVLHGPNPAHHPDADGERACVHGGVSRRSVPDVPASQVDISHATTIHAVHEPKIKATVTFYNVNLF